MTLSGTPRLLPDSGSVCAHTSPRGRRQWSNLDPLPTVAHRDTNHRIEGDRCCSRSPRLETTAPRDDRRRDAIALTGELDIETAPQLTEEVELAVWGTRRRVRARPQRRDASSTPPGCTRCCAPGPTWPARTAARARVPAPGRRAACSTSRACSTRSSSTPRPRPPRPPWCPPTTKIRRRMADLSGKAVAITGRRRGSARRPRSRSPAPARRSRSARAAATASRRSPRRIEDETGAHRRRARGRRHRRGPGARLRRGRGRAPRPARRR